MKCTEAVRVTPDGVVCRLRGSLGRAVCLQSDSPLFIEPLCHHPQCAASPLTPSSSQPHRDPSVCHPDADL